MKSRKVFYLLIMLIFYQSNYSQVEVKIVDDFGITLPGFSIKIDEITTVADFDGNFVVNLPFKSYKTDISFIFNEVEVEIKNIEIRDGKVDLGVFKFPSFKSISLYEYSDLNKFQKKQCYPVYHWTQLIGYKYKLKLEDDFLEWKINDKPFRIHDYKFYKNKSRVCVDYSKIEQQL